jgi:fatty-acyl-CoA synthase
MTHAAKYFSKKEIVSVYADQVFRYNYGDWYRRTCQLAHALDSLGIKRGDRVASFALNNHRHLELYFGAPGQGAVLHTLNVRLPHEHLIYIVDHAGDKVLFVEEDVIPLMEPVADKFKTVKHFVIMSQSGTMPETKMKPVVLYDDLIKDFPETYDWPLDRDEKEPALICYTSATTGDPKGVLYSHRGLVLHSMVVATSLGALEGDSALHIVPMFHANAWGAPFICTMLGMKQVLPGRQILDMKALCDIISKERVTFSCGVPTIWMMLYNYLEAGGEHDFSSVRAIYSGGSAMPPHIMKTMEEKYGLVMAQGYGATETSPVVSLSTPKSYMEGWSLEDSIKVRATCGHAVPGIEIKLVNSDGEEVRWDGKEMGDILIRGPWVASEYYKDRKQSKKTFKDGWLHIGDIGTIAEEGYVRMVDRGRDLIKSAGEWISSVDLENVIMEHPKIFEAAVIGIPDKKWQERPCACVVAMPGQEESLTIDEIKEFLAAKVARWWIPDEIVFLKEIPKTSVGKFSKKDLRKTVFPMLKIEDFG